MDLLFPRPYLDDALWSASPRAVSAACASLCCRRAWAWHCLQARRFPCPPPEQTAERADQAATNSLHQAGQLAVAPAPRKGEGEVEKLSRAFHAMALSLDQHEQQRRQFLADVAHELRTPLTIIQGRLEAILDGVIEPTPEEVAALHSQALLMGRLVHDLEMLALAQAKALTLHMEEVDPVTLASEALQAHVILAEREQLDLKLDVPDDVPTVHADPDRLKQVLSNLITNAIRHSHAQGTVTLRVEAAPRREGTRADIAYGVNDGSDLDELGVAFSVIDHGVGIPVEALPTVFEPFSRVDPSRTRKSGGSGLGLAIVRYLVEAHGGAVWVMSREGIGTRITAWLPAQAKTV